MDPNTRPFGYTQQLARELYTRHETRGRRTCILVYLRPEDPHPVSDSVSYLTRDGDRLGLYGTYGGESVADAADRCARIGAALRVVAAMRDAQAAEKH